MPVDWQEFEAVDAPKSDTDWSSFEAVEPAVKRNKLGESKEDLAWQMRNARMEGKLGNLTTDAITGLQNTAEVGADPIGAFSRTVAPVFNKLAGQTVASDYNEIPMQGILETPLMMVEDSLQLPRGYFKDESNPVKGITDSIENTATGLTNRKALPVLPLFGPEAGAVAPAASTVGKVLLGGQMAHDTTEAARNFGNVMADPNATTADKFNAFTGAGTAFGMTGATAGHMLPKVSDVPIPDFTGRDLPIPEGSGANPNVSQGSSDFIDNLKRAKPTPKLLGEPAAPIVPPEAPTAAAPEPEPVAPTPPDATDQLINAAQQGKFAVTPEAEALIQDILGQSSRDSRDVVTKPEENPISAQITQKLPEAPEDLQSQLDAEMGDSNVAEPKPEEPVATESNPSAIAKAEQWANDKLKGGGTSSGPDVLAAYAVKGAITIARGVKDFGEWSADMIRQLGDAVKPHLQDIWDRVKGQESPEAEAERVSKMSADEFNKFTPPGTATKAGYELAKRLGADGDKTKLAEYEKATVAELSAAMKKMATAAKEDRDKIFNDASVLNAKKQYFNEAQRMMTALGDIDRGMSVADAGRKNGIIESELQKYAAKPGSTGLAKNVRNVSGATGEGGFLGVDMAKLAKKFKEGKDATVDFTKQVTKETMGGKKMNDLRKSVLDWSAKLQRSFGEAAAMQKDLLKQVPDIKTRQGIVNWIQADGDTRVLTQRLAATADKHLAEGYRAALALTPEQIRVANQVKAQYADLAKKANHYDLLNTFKDNYVTQLWDLKKGPTGGSSSRTLRDKFRFAKASTFPTYFDGEQAGFTPKGDKDIAKILPVYMHDMNTVIAARQLVEQLWKGKASDGRPLLAPVGVGVPVDNAAGHATLIMPKAMKEKTSDYKVIPNQPALSAWRFAAKDSDGRPVMLKADLAVHPEAVGRLKAILGRSAIREWYDTPTSSTAAIPKAIAKGLDQFQSTTKRTMLGLISPFHQVQEGTHAVGHRVNPFFGIPKIDLTNDRGQMEATKHGLMLLPDRASEGQFMEGLRPSGLVSRIPGIGPVADHYSNYLFHEYIPGLKYKTYSAILERNNGVYAKDLRSGSVTPADIKVLSAEQTNAAFGHLNYADLARNPTIQHIMQLGLLAPDFLEARARFTGQGIKGLLGGKAGREQILALATLAVAQATLAYTSAKVTGGEWDKHDPFSFKLGNRRYTMRSVPEDIVSAMKDPRGFTYSRVSPIISKGLIQGFSGVDYRGKKVSLGDTAKELAQAPIPISAKGFLGIGNTSVSGWESMASAVGLKISRDTTSNDVHKMALDWMSKSTTPKVVQAYKDIQQRELPDSVYKPLKMSVENGDNAKIIQSVKDLLAVEPDQKARDKRKKEILREFNPFTKSPDSYDVKIKPFATRSKEFESAFIKSLDAAGKESYRQSVRDQVKAYRTLTQALYNKASDPKDTPELYRTR